MARPVINLAGQKYGRLTVLRFVRLDRGKDGKHPQGSIWACRCDCGAELETRSISLRTGNTKSCGCQKLEMFQARITKHGESAPQTPEYVAWNAMVKRCRPGRTSAKYHGDRGIVVCARWARSFENFLSDMGRKPSARHTLDRKDTEGPYDEENCRWATPQEQQRNRRDNVYLEARGQRRSLYAWAALQGVEPIRIYSRVRRGWTHERAIFEPVIQRARHTAG